MGSSSTGSSRRRPSARRGSLGSAPPVTASPPTALDVASAAEPELRQQRPRLGERKTGRGAERVEQRLVARELAARPGPSRRPDPGADPAPPGRRAGCSPRIARSNVVLPAAVRAEDRDAAPASRSRDRRAEPEAAPVSRRRRPGGRPRRRCEPTARAGGGAPTPPTACRRRSSRSIARSRDLRLRRLLLAALRSRGGGCACPVSPLRLTVRLPCSDQAFCCRGRSTSVGRSRLVLRRSAVVLLAARQIACCDVVGPPDPAYSTARWRLLLDLEDAVDGPVEERAVVRHDDDRAGCLVDEPLEAVEAGEVEVVRRLVEQEHVEPAQQDRRERGPCGLPARERGDLRRRGGRRPGPRSARPPPQPGRRDRRRRARGTVRVRRCTPRLGSGRPPAQRSAGRAPRPRPRRRCGGPGRPGSVSPGRASGSCGRSPTVSAGRSPLDRAGVGRARARQDAEQGRSSRSRSARRCRAGRRARPTATRRRGPCRPPRDTVTPRADSTPTTLGAAVRAPRVSGRGRLCGRAYAATIGALPAARAPSRGPGSRPRPGGTSSAPATASGTSSRSGPLRVGQHHGGEPGPLRREHLLLDATDRQHPALQRDLAGHPDVGRAPGGR